jgi:hypothetical protein
MKSTAIYRNRINDKIKLESELKLSEFGDSVTEFKTDTGILLAIGYNRLVYGDHGVYTEFNAAHIKCTYYSKFNNGVIDINNLPDIKDCKFYYYWLLVPCSDIKIYLQLKPVTDLPNAPKRNDGKKYKYNRAEGYADYRRGMFYISPYDMKFEGNIKGLF